MAKKTATKKPAKKSAKKPAAKSAAKKTAKKPAKKSGAKKSSKSGRPKASNRPRTPWFDAATAKPLISEYARRLQTFVNTMADGRVDRGELKAQEDRLTASMNEVEPLLGGPLHEKVTRLLCELAAYDMMQALHALQESRPTTVFRG